MAIPLTEILAANAWILAVAVAVDIALGDPVYPLHPVRLMGRSLAAIEAGLRRAGLDGYAGGIILFAALAVIWAGGLSVVLVSLTHVSMTAAAGLHAFLVYSFLALGDLGRHVWRVEGALARHDLEAARTAVANLVGRDTDRLDGAACRRAGIESLAESLTDGFVSAVFWYTLAGLPGLVVFKVASTMDSMVGYRTPEYERFGWAGARLDDVMNFVPARLTWLAVAGVASVLPGCSGAGALSVGLAQHAVLPGPNSGWSEAAVAGGIARRLVGPIWSGGRLVTDIWIGDPADPPASTRADVVRALMLVGATGLAAAVLAGACLVAL